MRIQGVRTVFWLHAFVTGYCVILALFDAIQFLPAWLRQEDAVLYALLLSPGLLPLAAFLVIRGSGVSHPTLLERTHVLMSFVQFIALLHLIA